MRVAEVVRRVTDRALEGVRVPILSGVNRGMWWSLVSSGSGYGSGRRASAQMQLLEALLRPGDIVWDVGAHHGYVTLCAARKVGAAGAVHAFEPSARNRGILKRHVGWNRLSNVTVHPYALSDRNGESRFGGSGTSKMYALGGGSELVQVRSAATLVADGVCAVPTFIKIDVEGAEADTLAGALAILPPNARMVIAVHTPEADERCTAILRGAGFEMHPSRALEACRAGPWRADPDLFCLGPRATGRDEDVARLRTMGF